METLNRLLNDLVAYLLEVVPGMYGFTFCQLGIPPFKKKKSKFPFNLANFRHKST